MQTGRTTPHAVRLYRAVFISAIALAVGITFANVSWAATTFVVGADCTTIQDCIDAAVDGDTVSIPAGNYTESLTLSGKAVSIVGADTATTIVDAAAGRVLTISGAAVDSTVVIEGLTLRNGDVSTGNICHPGDHTNCGGGVLITDGAAPLLQHLIIENNRAYEGGGLYADGGIALNIEDVSFLENTSVLSAGGAHFEDGAMIEVSRFERNESENNVGGGIRSAGPLTIYDSNFLDNTNTAAGAFAIAHGGAIYAFEADVTIEESLFDGNSCAHENCDGGGIYLSTSFIAVSLSLTDTDFIGNSAGRNGGAVHANVVSFGGTGNIDVVGGSFESNQSLGDATVFAEGGGGLSARGDVTIDGTAFINNSAVDAGGGVIMQGAVTTIANAYFESNSALRGGAIAVRPFLPGQQLQLTNTDLHNNTAEEDGGGAWVEFGGALITGGTIDGNAATEGNGGGAWIANGLTTDGAIFSNNSAGEDGGGFTLVAGNGGGAYIDAGDVNLAGGAFEGNQADGTSLFGEGGGGLHVSDGDLTATGTVFSSNIATASIGGGFRVNGDTELTNVMFENNEAATSGGGFAATGDITVLDSEFNRNAALGFSGGAILTFFSGAGSSISVDGSSFVDNSASAAGGAISTSIPITILSSTFTGNSVTTFGGGAVAASDTVAVTDSVFEDNVSGGAGGGLGASFDDVSITGSDFRNNTSGGSGGGLSANGTVTIESSLFVDNESTGGTGGGLTTSGQAHVSDGSEFYSNIASAHGGGVFANSGGSAEESIFSANTSGADGGGWASPLGSPILLSSTEFVQNHADGNGGALMTFDVGLIEKSTFDENTADVQAGAIYVRRGRDGLITTSLFVSNEATVIGGGIFFVGDAGGATTRRLNIDNSTFSGNLAPSGAGVGVENNSDPGIPTVLNLGNVTFAGNIGGALQAGANTNVVSTNVLVAGTCAGPGSFSSSGGNLESIGNTCNFVAATDQSGVSVAALSLGALAENGGPTQTHALVSGSAALNEGVSPCPAADQRGVPRLDGFCDVGAFEGFAVLIDVHPGSDMNPINLKKKGVIPVAILGADGFDVADIDVTSIAFGPGGALAAHDLAQPIGSHLEDSNGDGRTDLILHFHAQDVGLSIGDTLACVTGSDLYSFSFFGCDAVKVK